MDIQDTIKKVQDLGYEVGVAFELHTSDDPVTVYRVEGFGNTFQISSADEPSWLNLLQPSLQRSREMGQENREDDSNPPHSDRDILLQQLKGSVALGTYTQAEADAILAAHDKEHQA